MNHGKTIRLYNILFPIWMLIWIPSWLWLILIPANLLIDGLVLYYSQKKLQIEDPQLIRKHLWKVCPAGFLADLAGAVLLVLIAYNAGSELSSALTWNPFTNFWALLITLLAIALAGLLIYWFNRRIFRSYGIETAHGIALRMAVLTAPYLFLLPASLIY